MKHFKKLIETIRTGVFVDNTTLQDVPQNERERFFRAVPDIENIVIHNNLIDPYKKELLETDMVNMNLAKALDNVESGVPISSALDLPFDAMSFEIMDGHFQIDDLKDLNAEKDRGYIDEDDFAFRSMSTKYSDFNYESMGVNLTNRRHILCHVITPNSLYWLVKFQNDKYMATVSDSLGGVGLMSFTILTNIINQQRIGVEHVRQRVKIGIGKEKQTITIKKIIHIIPKGIKYERSLEGTTKLDFSHRFVRRGHWRTLTGDNQLGKNRSGEYCVQGRTWVLNSIVGDSDKPLIHKTRIVLPPKD